VKTVPTLRVVSKTDTVEQARQLDVELSAEVQVALADVGAVAREGLLAMSVAAGMAVMQTLFDAEVAAVCGPKGRHDAERVAFRHGRENGSVVLGGRCVAVTRVALPPPSPRGPCGEPRPQTNNAPVATAPPGRGTVLER
jgi:hypothetical protein